MFDWKLAKGTNSGVKYLVFGMRPNPEVGRLDPEVPKALGLELQLIDDEGVADAKRPWNWRRFRIRSRRLKSGLRSRRRI